MSTTKARIHFPVLRSIKVDGYELFPGKDGMGGIDHAFKPGITVISGINGLGKTTLLNIILRTIVGPAAAKKDEAQIGRSSSHETKIIKPFDLFRDRVSDEALDAKVGALFTVGDQEIYIERSLANLEITTILVDSRPFDGELTHEKYQDYISKLCGLSQFYDFYFVIKNMVFFLEDRVPLIWREEDQFEIFRILYSGTDNAKKLSDLHSKIKKVDSDYRNQRWHINKEEKSLSKKKKNEGEADKSTREYNFYLQAYKGLEERYKDFEDEIKGYLDHRDKLIEKIEVQKIDLEERQRAYEGYQQRYFSSVFPKINETAEYMLIHLASASGCLVCGSKNTDEISKRFQLLAEKCICPICSSAPDLQESLNDNNPTINATEFGNERLKAEYDKLKKERSDFEKLNISLIKTENKIKELYEERSETSEKLMATERSLSRIKAQLPVAADELRKQAEKLEGENKILSGLRVELEGLWGQYKALLHEATENIEALVNDIKSYFEEYASKFLAEKCELNYRIDERKIGQEGPKFSFPSFDVLMTSGVFSKPQARKGQSDVSESQQEFIDLAFRMALMSAISSNNANFMMILETPEASLDSIFIEQAGHLLRRFAGGGKGKGNVLIATSNLNAGDMIGELLKQGDETLQKSSIQDRLINLLEIAAPNAALNLHRDRYFEELKKNIDRAQAA